MKKNNAYLQWMLLTFLLGFVFFLYLFLSNLNLDTDDDAIITKSQDFSYSHEINNAVTFIHNNQFQIALNLLARLNNLELSDKQFYAIGILESECNKALGLYNTAIENIDNAIKYQEKPFAYYLKGNLLQLMDNRKLAIEAFEKALEVDKFYYYAYEKLGDLFFQESDYRKALTYYHPKQHKRSFISDGSILKISLCHFYLNEMDQALTYNKKYIQISKKKRFIDMAYFLKAINHTVNTTDFDETKDLYEKSISLGNKRSRDVYKYFYALYLIKNNFYKKAIDTLQTVSYGDGIVNPHVNKTLGQIYLINRDFGKSLRFFNKNKNFDLDYKDIYFFGVCLFKLGKHEEAIKQFKKVLDKDHKDEYARSAHILSSLSYGRLGKIEKALGTLEKANEFWPDSPKVLKALSHVILKYAPDLFYDTLAKYFNQEKFYELNLYLADYYYNHKNFKPAISVLLDYMQQEKLSPRLLKITGDLYLQINDYNNALTYYQKAFKEMNTIAGKSDILNNMTYANYELRNFQKAEENINAAVRMQSRNALYYYNSAIFYKGKDIYDKYEENLNNALKHVESLENKDGKSKIFLEKGLDSLFNGNRASSRKYFKRALKINPRNNIAEYNLRQLN